MNHTPTQDAPTTAATAATPPAPAHDGRRDGTGAGATVSHAPRLNYGRVAPDAVRAQFGLELFVHGTGLERSLLELVRLRASQLNGCAYCVDMHTKDARLEGETEQRLYAVSAWHEAPFFTARERAALAWTETVTELPRGGVSDEAYAAVRAQFDEDEVVALTMAVVAINGWNRLAVSFRAPVGSYVAGSHARMLAQAAGARG